MQHMNTRRRFGWSIVTAVVVSLAVAACGGSSGSGDASQLLHQTFTGPHHINSGNLSFVLSIDPSGSTTFKGPVTLSLGGPFQSRGTGQLPQSAFTVSLGANGKTGALTVISTGTAGYVTLGNTSYQLPAATFQKLEQSFAQVAPSSGSSSSSSSNALGKLGIQPLNWLRNPTIVGDETVGGTSTTHIRAAVNVSALINDLSTFLKKAASTGVSGASQFSGGLSASERQQIAGAVRNPQFDVWTGKSDKTLRKLHVALTVPVSGQLSTLTGGVNSAGIGLTIQYANLNQPQTITAPANIRPFTEFQSKVQSFVQTLQGTLSGASSSAGGTGSSSSSSSSSAGVASYSQCIQAAGSDVSKMQQCASLLNGK
jgi:hypothetical protein